MSLIKLSEKNLIPALAFRFLRSKQADGFISLISWVSVAGVILGVLSLIVVTSVINGFESELQQTVTSLHSHVLVYTRTSPLEAPERVEEKLKKMSSSVRAISRSFITELMVAGPHGVSGALLEGFDPETYGLVTRVPERLSEGRLPQGPGEVAVGSELAKKLDLKVGSEIRLIAPFAGAATTMEGTAKTLEAKVTGIVRLGLYDFDSKIVFAVLPVVQDFFEQAGRATSFKVMLAPGADAQEYASKVALDFGYPFRAKDWTQMNSGLYRAIQLEKVVIAILLAAIIVVAAFNMLSTLMMLIHDKIREISILKAMGLSGRSQFQLFCLIGMSIGVVGVVLGTVFGLTLNQILAQTRLIEIPAEIYHIGFLPVIFRWNEIALIGFSALTICFFATLYPALRVGSRSPLEGIRYE